MSKLNRWMRACGAFLLWATAAVAVPAQTFKTLHNFDNTDGADASAPLVQATNGNFYGTTSQGGTEACQGGCGTVFKINPSGTLTTLHSFDVTDGWFTSPVLVQATNGNLFGATFFGGASDNGTFFKITPSGTLTTLHNFDYTDGLEPVSLVQAPNGSFYGTTMEGGLNGYGTFFKTTPAGPLTTLYNFCSQSSCADGQFPQAGLIQATDGNFYGTTQYGGANNNSICFDTGCGTVFKITPNGALTTLYSFCPQSPCPDGANPQNGLVQGTDGNFYGTTNGGGTENAGTVFKITPSGTLTTLHTFEGREGAYPAATLVQGTDGDFYGTAELGGNIGACGGGCGTVFKITPSGTLTPLYNFKNTDGQGPAGLVQATNGNFYGTTIAGGLNGYGTVFGLSVGLGTFVKTNPVAGKVGGTVNILGTHLKGATGLTFNGTSSAFTVNSTGTAISTTVPAGATSGAVQVVTPGGTLSSNVPFQVLP